MYRQSDHELEHFSHSFSFCHHCFLYVGLYVTLSVQSLLTAIVSSTMVWLIHMIVYFRHIYEYSSSWIMNNTNNYAVTLINGCGLWCAKFKIILWYKVCRCMCGFSCETAVFSWHPWLVGWVVSCDGSVCGEFPVPGPCAGPGQPCTPQVAAESAF